ncbi:hypothetical protein B0T24DRAFT_303892 [Lasiosphaeria ovina]|uniref:Uncharacterized protein n=1 Tax=Lasiosphaeria ovina TaxID=92902 RepID=A0AAE0N691_9PEZI|nr:hypothetical protein B0T24DRAFT_303892 [Lasiosphaeria ovina]
MMEQQRRYFLLSEPCSAAEIPKMMCRVVANKYLPLQRYAPKEPLGGDVEPSHNTNQVIPDILPPASKSASQADFMRNARDASLKASLMALFGIGAGRGDDATVKLDSKEVKRYTLANPKEYFEKLMRNELYARDVNQILDDCDGRKAYLVTGFLTTNDALWTFSSSVSSTKEFNVTIPVAEVLGVPVPISGLDPELSTTISRSRERSRQMRVLEEEIFAVAYSVIRSRGTGWIKRGAPTAVLTGPVRVKARHLAFGDDSGEEVDDEDSVDGLELIDEDEEGLDDARGVEF